MRKYIITFRNKVFDGQRWLSFVVVDSYYPSLENSKTYDARIGERVIHVPVANVLAIVESTAVKIEKERG